MSRLNITFHTHRPARCPWCQIDLSPQGCTIVDGVMVCVDCSRLRSLLDVRTLDACRAHDPSGKCWSVCKGIAIYTPPEHYGRSHSAVVADLGELSPLKTGPVPGNSR
jgi:hypothetical protein